MRMALQKKYIAPGAWFSMSYPASWNEFEDTEDSFLFYNPDEGGWPDVCLLLGGL